MLSPTRTSGCPPTLTPVLARGPMTSGYGKPQTELIMRHIEPAVASGIPPAVMTGGKMARIVPASGGPDAPGVTLTMQPIVTGGPGIDPLYGAKEVTPFTEIVAPCSVADMPPSIVAPVLAVMAASICA
jgi:hypothetical protein